jgi:Spy/CpxP family protein refolding chaperone
MMKKFKMTLMAIALLSISIATFAAVTFNPSTGIGFVGKGDVQNAFGWNNADLQ